MKSPSPQPPGDIPPVELAEETPVGRIRRFMRAHGSKLWWLHTAYALGLGASVVAFASKGFLHARWLSVSLGIAWLLLVLFFRFFGTGSAQQNFKTASTDGRIRFLVMTYVLKNLYQGMLFFLLPFYWKSSSFGTANFAFVVVLGMLAILSTLDIVFDRVLMRWKAVATFFYGVTLFSCLNLIIPALLPNTRTIYTIISAAAITTIAFWTFHVPLAELKKKKYIAILVGAVSASSTLAWFARSYIPPVPMYLESGAVGPMQLEDGRLSMEVKTLHTSVIQALIAVTDIVTPGGKGDKLRHVWKLEEKEVSRAPEDTSHVDGPEGAVRLRSDLTASELPPKIAGKWTIDVETEDGQLVGRVSFKVIE